MVSRDEEAGSGVSQENMRRRYCPGEMLDERILTGQAGYKVVGLRKVKTPSIENSGGEEICQPDKPENRLLPV